MAEDESVCIWASVKFHWSSKNILNILVYLVCVCVCVCVFMILLIYWVGLAGSVAQW
jgi:hypothetical protein